MIDALRNARSAPAVSLPSVEHSAVEAIEKLGWWPDPSRRYSVDCEPVQCIDRREILKLLTDRLGKPVEVGRPLSPDDVQWVVNDIAELGVRIGDQVFFLYKGESLVYTSHDDGSPMLFRPVGKREFGEVVHPFDFKGLHRGEYYTVELVFHPVLSFGAEDDPKYKWQQLPQSPSVKVKP
jgi:hypothetical protein